MNHKEAIALATVMYHTVARVGEIAPWTRQTGGDHRAQDRGLSG